MGERWVKLHRSMLDHWVSNDAKAFSIFLYLLLMANYSDGKQSIYHNGGQRYLKAGEVLVGRQQIAERLKISPSTVRNVLNRLKNGSLIELESDSRGTIVYICNWEQYQTDWTAKGQPEDSKRTYKKIKDKDNTLSKDKVSQVPVGTVTEIYKFYLEKFNTTDRYKLSEQRKTKIKARLRDAGEDMLRQAISNTAANGWYRGDNDRGWCADLDYIIRTYENVEKLANLGDGQDVPSLEEGLNAI